MNKAILVTLIAIVVLAVTLCAEAKSDSSKLLKKLVQQELSKRITFGTALKKILKQQKDEEEADFFNNIDEEEQEEEQEEEEESDKFGEKLSKWWNNKGKDLLKKAVDVYNAYQASKNKKAEEPVEEESDLFNGLDEAEEESDKFGEKLSKWWNNKGKDLLKKAVDVYNAYQASKNKKAEEPAEEESDIPTQKINQFGLDLIKHFEGWYPCVYDDPIGLPTIGFGHLILPGEKFTCITKEQGEVLLKTELVQHEVCVAKAVSAPINSNQYSALVSFSYNVGCGNLNKSTLLKKVNARASRDEVCAEFLKWNKAGGKVFAGLTRRRQAECDLYRK